MTEANSNFILSAREKQDIEETLRSLLKEEVTLRQSIREEKEKSQANQEELFLELLEIFDAMESLINYLAENPEPNPKIFQRLPKSLETIQKKLLIILGRRNVNKIELQDTTADFSLCRVVDCEVRDDIKEQTITKVIRQGFKLEDKLLRPVDVITSQQPPVN